MRFETKCVRAGQKPDPTTGAINVPINLTTAYQFNNSDHAKDLFNLDAEGYIYTRIGNPTTDVFEQRMTELDNGVGALATASGQAAISYAILNITNSGENIISSSSVYGGTQTLFRYTFKKMGITTKFFDPDNVEDLESLIDDKTKAIFVEILPNPKNNIVNIKKIADIAHKNNLPLIVDNTVITPFGCTTKDFGADIVVYSSTKFLGGHGNSIGGIIVDTGNFDWENDKFPELTNPDPSYHGMSYTKKFKKLSYIVKARIQLLRDMGAVLSPFNAFMFLTGLETLPLRMQKHFENAQKIAEYLEKHTKVKWINYPGLKSSKYHNLAKKQFNGFGGAIISFGIKGGYKNGLKFIENLKLCYNVANIGDTRTLITHPASTTHSQLSEKEKLEAGVPDELLRLSIGIENFNDIVDDLEQAFNKIKI